MHGIVRASHYAGFASCRCAKNQPGFSNEKPGQLRLVDQFRGHSIREDTRETSTQWFESISRTVSAGAYFFSSGALSALWLAESAGAELDSWDEAASPQPQPLSPFPQPLSHPESQLLQLLSQQPPP
jgi:hypothetical protein